MNKKIFAVVLFALAGEAWAGSASQGLPELSLPSLQQILAQPAQTLLISAAPSAQCAGITVPSDPNNVPIPEDLWNMAFAAIKFEFLRVNGRHVLAPSDVLDKRGGLWQQGGSYLTNQLYVTADVNGWPNWQINDRGIMECHINLTQDARTCVWAADAYADCEPK